LIGLLYFACLVVRPGRPFLRRLIDLTRNITNPFYFVKLNCETRANLHAWSLPGLLKVETRQLVSYYVRLSCNMFCTKHNVCTKRIKILSLQDCLFNNPVVTHQTKHVYCYFWILYYSTKGSLLADS
jgi:hypothetical protein